MRIAVIADLHGNLVALEAVLAALADERTDGIVCLGDVAATGPQPRETVERLRAVGCPVVMGNADAWLLDPPPDEAADEQTRRILEIDRWCAARLSTVDLDYLRAFQSTIELPLGDGASLLCSHGSPRSYNDSIVATTPEEELEPMLSGFGAAVLAGGHTHTPLLRRYGDLTIVNPGSVGLPYERARQTGQVRNPPWAEYALVAIAEGGLCIEFRRAQLDARAVMRAARDSGMPHAAWWASAWR